MFKIAGGLLRLVGQPVHENITLAALLAAKALPGEIDYPVTYDKVSGGNKPSVGKLDVFEVIRGVFSNDDPDRLLFWNRSDNNGSFGVGYDFYEAFKGVTYPIRRNNITQRSHFGDLQFLHAMASSVGEDSRETRDKIMIWMECMYRLAVGESVSENDRIDSRLNYFFNDTTTPKGSNTLRKLLMGSTPSYSRAIIPRRALGSCLHIIQDSYAVGHCRRKLLNPQDMTEKTFYDSVTDYLKPIGALPLVKAFPNVPAKFGMIHNFHCYSGQDERHALYDKYPYGAQLIPNNPVSFNSVIGAFEALDHCSTLAEHWYHRTPWSVVEPWLKTAVFPISRHATNSNTQVDEGLGQEPAE